MATAFLAVVFMSVNLVVGLCPHESSLAKWSDASAWSGSPGVSKGFVWFCHFYQSQKL